MTLIQALLMIWHEGGKEGKKPGLIFIFYFQETKISRLLYFKKFTVYGMKTDSFNFIYIVCQEAIADHNSLLDLMLSFHEYRNQNILLAPKYLSIHPTIYLSIVIFLAFKVWRKKEGKECHNLKQIQKVRIER